MPDPDCRIQLGRDIQRDRYVRAESSLTPLESRRSRERISSRAKLATVGLRKISSSVYATWIQQKIESQEILRRRGG
jgi:hypothetical protein